MINIVDKRDCCGCTACQSICPKKCISMVSDDEGFAYPIINKDLCIDCGACEKVCPIINYQHKENTPKVFGLINKDNDTIRRSTSGGAFWGIVEYVLAHGGVVYGAAYDEDFKVKHCREFTSEGCRKFHGAKYVESKIDIGLLATVRDDLKANRIVLFSGTPCQIAGLLRYLRKPYDNLITVDLVCSSVPSRKIYNDFLTFVAEKKNLASINMRWKGNGWLKSCAQFTYTDGSMDRGVGFARLWHTIAFSHLVTRPSCYDCRFTNFNRQGDFTVGDYWGVDKEFPELDNNKGISLLLVNTDKGSAVFEKIKDKYIIQPSDVKHCKQPRLIYPVTMNPKRDVFWREYNSQKFDHIARKYWKYGLWNQIKGNVRMILSHIYHNILRQ